MQLEAKPQNSLIVNCKCSFLHSHKDMKQGGDLLITFVLKRFFQKGPRIILVLPCKYKNMSNLRIMVYSLDVKKVFFISKHSKIIINAPFIQLLELGTF